MYDLEMSKNMYRGLKISSLKKIKKNELGSFSFLQTTVLLQQLIENINIQIQKSVGFSHLLSSFG